MSKNIKILSKKHRKIKRISLKELSAKIDCSESYLSQLETGHYTRSPRLELIIAIQKELKVKCLCDLIDCGCNDCDKKKNIC